ncbi:MAG: UPF0158 family protein [Polyangiaceae bacterium]
MANSDRPPSGNADGNPQWRDVPIDWEALEDAFENNAPEVHSYLHVPTGDVLRIVDGIADPQMHARIAADTNYLRIEPVSSREQYRWMERFIPMLEESELQQRLTRAIDGKGAFRRFKDVLMSFGAERERWFAFRSERLRIFMEAWLNAHALTPVKRPVWVPDMVDEKPSEASPSRRESRRGRSAEALRRQLRDIIEALGPRELDNLAAFGEFLRTRRGGKPSRSSSHDSEKEWPTAEQDREPEPAPKKKSDKDDDAPSSSKVAKRASNSD